MTVWERICVYILIAGLIFGLGFMLERAHQQNMELSKEIAQLQSDEKQRDAQTAQQLVELAKQQAAVKTPAQAAQAIPQHLPMPLPQPITVNIPPATVGQPAPDAVATIPQVDLKPFFDGLVACQAAELQVPQLKQDLADEKQINAALKKKNSFGKKVLTAAKYVGIGIGIGAILVVASGH